MFKTAALAVPPEAGFVYSRDENWFANRKSRSTPLCKRDKKRNTYEVIFIVFSRSTFPCYNDLQSSEIGYSEILGGTHKHSASSTLRNNESAKRVQGKNGTNINVSQVVTHLDFSPNSKIRLSW